MARTSPSGRERRRWKERALSVQVPPGVETGYPEDEPALFGEPGHGAHDRAEPRDHPCPEVVTVGKATGQHDCGHTVHRRLLVPQLDRLGAGDGQAVERVAVAV